MLALICPGTESRSLLEESEAPLVPFTVAWRPSFGDGSVGKGEEGRGDEDDDSAGTTCLLDFFRPANMSRKRAFPGVRGCTSASDMDVVECTLSAVLDAEASRIMAVADFKKAEWSSIVGTAGTGLANRFFNFFGVLRSRVEEVELEETARSRLARDNEGDEDEASLSSRPAMAATDDKDAGMRSPLEAVLLFEERRGAGTTPRPAAPFKWPTLGDGRGERGASEIEPGRPAGLCGRAKSASSCEKMEAGRLLWLP